jgi:TorA maturation chaperone TorD
LREAQAWQAGDTALARERIGQQREFIARHLAAWAPRWAQSVALHSREPLFAALAGLVAPALDDTRAELDQTVESFNAAL